MINVHVVDFESSKFLEEYNDVDSEIIGTKNHLAPEVFQHIGNPYV